MLLMTIAAKSLSSVSAGVTRVATIGAAGTIQLVRALIHRREVMRLGAELDERGLKDIGLVRSDIDGALAASWLDDPSAVPRGAIMPCAMPAPRRCWPGRPISRLHAAPDPLATASLRAGASCFRPFSCLCEMRA